MNRSTTIATMTALVALVGTILLSLASTSVSAQGFFLQNKSRRELTSSSIEVEDVMPTFESIQRHLISEAGITTDEDEMKSIIDGSDRSWLQLDSTRRQQRRTQETSGPELSFMIMMDEFDYSNDVDGVSEITIGTRLAFTGRIVTKAEELGVASGTCTVTSDVQTDLSYCTIFHKIDTDNFGGYGTVMASGSVDEVGGRLSVTGTGGTLAANQDGYAMVQADPAGNPVIYVMLKLH